MKFLPVFDLRVRQPFYADGRCPDFALEPSAATAVLLRNHRALLKPLSDGVRVLAAVADDGTPFIPVARGERFSFHLRLMNADFPLFTDLSDIQALDAPLYTNADLRPKDGVELSLRSRALRFRENLEVAKPASHERLVLHGKPMDGLGPADFKVESSGRVQGVEAYDDIDKLITVDSRSASKGETFAVEYPVRPSLPRGVFADVDIVANETLPQLDRPSDPPREFQVHFPAKLARWVYYCITDIKSDPGDFHISGPDSRSGVTFGDKNRTDLTKAPDPADGVANELAQRYPGVRRLRFVSDERVPCRQAPRKLALTVDGNQLSTALPNPPLHNYASLQIQVGDRLQKQDALFQVVKYLTQSFSMAGV